MENTPDILGDVADQVVAAAGSYLPTALPVIVAGVSITLAVIFLPKLIGLFRKTAKG